MHKLDGLAEQINLLKDLRGQLAVMDATSGRLPEIRINLQNVQVYVGTGCIHSVPPSGAGSHSNLANTVVTLVGTRGFSESLREYIQRQIDAVEERIREALKEANSE